MQNIDIKTEFTVQETQQRILTRINEALDNISTDGSGLDDSDDRRDGPPKDIRAARLINELALSYRYLTFNGMSITLSGDIAKK